MKNVCAYGCICCHRVMTNNKENKVKGGLDGLKRQLDEKNPELFKKCILDKELLPKALRKAKDVYLCNTCDIWLKERQEMPPMCYNNGLGVDKRPPALKDLNDLEATLISKRILFLKIFKMPVSRWHVNNGQTVNVPIDEDTILETLDKVTTFPRLPDEAGLIAVDLKRKLEYKNTHEHSYVQPWKMVKAVEELKECNHRGYTDIRIENRYSVLADLPDRDDTDNEREEEVLDCIERNQFDLGGATTLINTNPEASVLTNIPQNGSPGLSETCTHGVVVAPGEGKVPTSLTKDEHWVVDAFPQLFPTGLFGLYHPRERKLTTQQYFCQRLQNIAKRFCSNTAFLFAALYCITRQRLESALGISYMRGKIVQGQLTNLEDACCVFDNLPGSFRYWQKKRYEVIAKLEQLGPFQFFFTLSCADKRWDKNFVAILQQKGLTINYRPCKVAKKKEGGKFAYQADNIFVQEEGKDEVPLKEFLANEDLHEMVRQNVLTITMIFDKRVHAFMSKIVMGKNSPMKTKYYHYRVEFQKRGAGHIHGVLWVDLNEVEKESMENPNEDERLEGLEAAMNKLRSSKPHLDPGERAVVAKFVDKFVTCSLDDEDLADTVKEVQKHSHKGSLEKKTGCYTKGPKCRFSYPRFPSEKTIIAQPLKKEDINPKMSDRAFEKKSKELKEILEKVKEVLVGLDEDEQNIYQLSDILKKAGVQEKDYYKALAVSQTGACVILKRSVKELYINNYNKEWLKAWDGNMDLAVCLDFFAIITYITDYYTKTETEMMKNITTAAKACKERGDDMKTQRRHLVQTFLTSRQVGECESYYMIVPSLHLSESNLKCVFLATGFPENRSNMIRPVKDKQPDDAANDDDESDKNIIKIEGSDKTFKKATSMHDRYAARPQSIEHMCLAQFAISFDSTTGKQAQAKGVFVDDSSVENNEEMKIVSWNEQIETTKLPRYIKLKDNLGYMKCRTGQAVLRYHKVREDKNPHEYYYSHLLLYKPWREEEKELFLHDQEKCRSLFEDSDRSKGIVSGTDDEKTNIEKTEEKLFPNKSAVEEGRAVVALLDDHRPTHIGDVVDPQNEIENEMAENEGLEEDEEHAGRFPSEAVAQYQKNDLPTQKASGIYQQIPIPTNDSELAKLRQACRILDADQRVALDKMLKLVKQLRAASPGHKPDPVFLKVHGGAGAGKTSLINAMATVCEYFLRVQNRDRDMTDPRKPAVMKLAPIGLAAKHVDGLTLHSALNFPFGNIYLPLSERTRESKKNALTNLTILIIDEMSMVKADMLYQLHMRLQEIKGNKRNFGGVSILICGDLVQLPPVNGAQIFEPPKGEKFRQYHEMNPLWDLFESVDLKTNHRQGNDKIYGDLLNRIRKNEQTEEDLQTLALHISDEWPEEDVYYVFGLKAPGRKYNEERLEKLLGEAEVISATHISKTKPQIDPKDGTINNTSFLDKLKLKVGARIMLIHNYDTSDRLTNGTCGEVMGFEWSRGENPVIQKILVQFDDNRDGLKTRKRENIHLRYPRMPLVTPISRISFEYSIGKRWKNHSAKAKVIQFPMALGCAITAHKCEGMNILAPTKLVADLNTCWKPGMGYVMLGRVQNSSQLHLRWSYDPIPKKDEESERNRQENNLKAAEKLLVAEDALAEAEKISNNALNNEENRRRDDWLTKKCLKVTSLNIQGSLNSRLEDLKADPTIYMISDIICLQEVGDMKSNLELPGYSCYSSVVGHKQGVAVFVKNEFVLDMTNEPLSIGHKNRILSGASIFQCLKLSFLEFDLVTVYRSPDMPQHGLLFSSFSHAISNIVDKEKPTIMCGDFNFDQKEVNELTRNFSETHGFRQIVEEPTTYRGYCIDHIYHNMHNDWEVCHKLHYPYYSDHEALCIMLIKSE